MKPKKSIYFIAMLALVFAFAIGSVKGASVSVNLPKDKSTASSSGLPSPLPFITLRFYGYSSEASTKRLDVTVRRTSNNSILFGKYDILAGTWFSERDIYDTSDTLSYQLVLASQNGAGAIAAGTLTDQ